MRVVEKILLCLLAVLISFPADAQNKNSKKFQRLSDQLAPYHSDPDKLDFLASEAYSAGVRRFKFTKSSSNFGSASTNGTIELSTALRGGTGVINITHEIAHMRGFRRNCSGHKKCWIKIYLDIAKRYEERFPNEKWSGVTPTQRVLRNLQRYGIKM